MNLVNIVWHRRSKIIVKAMTWMVGALLSFCLMAVGARELSGEINTAQVMLFRSTLGLVVIFLILFATKQTALIHSSRIGLHCVRNGFHFMGQYGWLVGITVLPLAEVFALEFTVPLWTALIAWLCLGETLTLRKLSAILLGLLGVMVIVKPGMAVFNLSSFIVLGAACCYAISHTSTKSLAVTESPLTILFYMSLVQLPLGLLLTLNHWTTPTLQQSGWLFIIGATALTAHFCMTKAMQHAEVSIVVILDFMRLPAIGMVGAVLYGENLAPSLLIGALIMLIGNIFALWQPKTAVKTLKS